MTAARRLRDRLATGEVLLVGGAYNALEERVSGLAFTQLEAAG